MRIVITGATGLIGQNLLFEIIKQNLRNLHNVQIIVLGRDKDGNNIHKRIKEMVLNEGIPYVTRDKSDIGAIREYCQSSIISIYADLSKKKLGLKDKEYRELKKTPIDFFFHLAAVTDLRDMPRIEHTLVKVNVGGTKQILELISSLKVREFCYTGTAYSCGDIAGSIKPDYINRSNKFRNPYEKTKLDAELLVRDFARKTKTRCRYFRPSVTCGRLIEQPLGAVNKFDVFYGWAAFFFQVKIKELANGKDIYDKPLKLDMRIRYNLKSGLNIVPADFVAKTMYQICVQNDSDESYYLVNNQETPHGVYIPLMLQSFNIAGPRQVDVIPDDMNHLERLYYKTVGKVFTPYITSDPILFDTSNLSDVLHRANLKCPVVDEKNFLLLMDYAKKHDFGIDKNNESAVL
ncbi:MAG: SDR family oxidoreductase [Candidatus Omnitrophota bacterium]